MNDITFVQPAAAAAISEFTPETVFAPGGVAATIERVAADARAVPGDATTPAGRKAIASAAYKVARTKTALDEMGKKLTDEWRARTNAVNEDRRRIRESLDALADEVRAPLTKWEGAEKARVAAHEAALDEIVSLAIIPFGASSYEIADRIARLSIGDNRDWQEFKDRASDARATSADTLNAALAQAQAREAQAAELAALKAAEEARTRAEAARVAAERVARLVREAAERATREAEEAARRREQAAADAAAAAERKADADRLAAAEAVARAEERARRAEADQAAAAAQAERDSIAAVDAERAKIARAEQAAADEAKRREANKAHRAKINNAAAAGLMTAGLDEATAKIAVAAIARREIPHVTIAY